MLTMLSSKFSEIHSFWAWTKSHSIKSDDVENNIARVWTILTVFFFALTHVEAHFFHSRGSFHHNGTSRRWIITRNFEGAIGRKLSNIIQRTKATSESLSHRLSLQLPIGISYDNSSAADLNAWLVLSLFLTLYYYRFFFGKKKKEKDVAVHGVTSQSLFENNETKSSSRPRKKEKHRVFREFVDAFSTHTAPLKVPGKMRKKKKRRFRV